MQPSSDLTYGFFSKRHWSKSNWNSYRPSYRGSLSASLIAPFFVPRINSVLDSVPFLRDHKSLSSIVAGIVVFGVAKTPRIPNIVSAVIVGIAGVFILAGILPLYTQITNRSAS